MRSEHIAGIDSRKHPVCGMLLHAYYVRDPRVQREAQALRDAGWRVKVICLNEGPEKKRETIDGIEVIRCNLGRPSVRSKLNYVREYLSFMLRSAVRLIIEDMRERCDVVIVHNMPNALVFSAFGARLRGCPVILDMHDAAPEVFERLFGIRSLVFRKLVLIEERLAMSFASALITVNRGVENVFKKRHPKAAFFLLHNSPSSEHLEQLAIPDYGKGEPFRIVFHGHIHERYGLQGLIRVLPAVVEKGVDATVDVFGDGPYKEAVRSLADELGVSDRVRFHGRFKPSDLPVALSGKHVGVALHHKDDLGDLLLSVKILEYTQAGLPVLSSNLATIQAYFDDEAMVFFATDEELRDRIVEMADNYAKARERVAKAREVVSEISWERESATYVDFVGGICGRA